MYKKSITAFLVIFFYHATCGQLLPFKRYTSKDGLIADRITTVAQDEKGFMWFGSYFGICRYNGVKFETILLPAAQQYKYVTSILCANKKVYAGFLFGGGLAVYDGLKVTSFFIPQASNDIVSLYNDKDGSILLANSSNKVYRFQNGVFEHVFSIKNRSSSIINCLRTDKYLNIWLGTDDGLFIIKPDKTFVSFYQGENIFSLLADDVNKIWLARQKEGITIIETYEGFNNSLINSKAIASLSGINPIRFSGNISNGFWAIVLQGLSNISPEGRIEYFKSAINLNTEITYIFNDRENNTWIANEPGLIKIPGLKTQSFLFNEIAAGGGSIIYATDSSLWATNAKFFYHLTKTGISKTADFRLQGQDYFGTPFLDSEKNLWVGLWNKGLWKTKWKNGRITEKKYFDSYKGKSIKASSIIEDPNGNIWIASAGGIFILKDDVVIEHFHPKNNRGDLSFITAMSLDAKKKEIWLGDNTEGIIHLKYSTLPDGSFTFQTLNFFTSKNGLNDEFIRSIHLDKEKKLWVGTRSGGIFKITQTLQNQYVITNENQEAKLACARVTQIKEDKRSVWFATCNGVYRYDHKDKKWSQYNTGNGLLASEIFSIAIDEDRNLLFALSAEGISQLEIELDKTNVPPLINITSVNVLGKPDSLALFANKKIKYSYNENSIGFSFAGASFVDEKNIQYKYMLKGYDEDWNGPVLTNQVNYASLPAGVYTFKVLALNSNGIWSTQPSEFSFEIIMPIFRRPWFIFLILLVLSLIIYLIRIQRLKQLYKIEKLRLSIARDLHDDVGSGLGSINLISETATRNLQQNVSEGEAVQQFKKISTSAQYILDAMDDIVWAINPEKDTIEDLVIRMREFAIPLLEGRNIESKFEIEADDYKKLSMDLKRNTFLVFKEAIYNILKHSGASAIIVKMSMEKGQFILEITDNGQGFDALKKTNRNGLKNMLKRAEEAGGILVIDSSAEGTSLNLKYPVR